MLGESASALPVLACRVMPGLPGGEDLMSALRLAAADVAGWTSDLVSVGQGTELCGSPRVVRGRNAVLAWCH